LACETAWVSFDTLEKNSLNSTVVFVLLEKLRFRNFAVVIICIFRNWAYSILKLKPRGMRACNTFFL